MPIAQTSQFDMKLAGPIEVDRQVQTINDRNAIITGKRWEGMLVYVIQGATGEGETYILKGGLDNSYWQIFEGGGGEGGSTFLADTLADI